MFNINFVKPAYKTVIQYSTIFFAFVFLNASTPFLAPFSFSAFNALSISGFNPVILGILCVLSCLLTGLTKIVLPISVAIFVMCLVFCFYRAKNIRPSFELIVYILVSLLYFILSNADNVYALIVYAVIMTLLSFLGVGACNFIFLKGIKYEPSAEETIFLFLAFSLLTLGALNTLPTFFIKIFAVYTVLFLSKCAGGTLTFSVALLFGIPFSIYFSNIAYIAVFILITGIGMIFNPITHYLSGVLILFFDYLFFALFKVYDSYGVYGFLSVFLSVSAFLITPNKLYDKLKEYLCSKKSKTLIRKTVNENLLLIKERLYSVSEVFSEISSAMCEFKKNELKEDDAVKLISEETFKNCCIACSSYFRCKEFKKDFTSEMKSDLNKFVKIGMAKGRVSFIDVPKSVSDCCLNVNGIIFAVNKELSEYRNILLDNGNFSLSRELVSKQAEGVSEVLKNLAYENAKDLKYRFLAEEKASEQLKRKGFSPLEILIYGDDDEISVTLVIKGENENFALIEKTLSNALKVPLKIYEKSTILEDKTFLLLKKPLPYQVAYAVATKNKNGSALSGDTHSETKISGGKFLFAVSDGMGSGEKAKRISDVTLSLIESFYKAGLKSQSILPLVNKLLAINTDDSFSALDIAVLNLNDLRADFIKFGAPRGFLISKDGIKIIEGNTLPIGIIKELEPTIISTNLSDGDMLVLMSDGIADAFKSTNEILEFFKKLPALNPKNIADETLKEALKLNNEIALDDMTVLAFRVFKNKNYVKVA